MENTKIDEMYNKMLNVADNISTEGLTNDAKSDLEEIKEFVDSTNEETTTDNKPSGETVMGIYNPQTGEVMATDKSAEIIDNIKKRQWNNFISDGDEEIDPDNLNMDIVKDILDSNELREFEESTKMASLISRRLKGEKVNAYLEFPEYYKKQIDDLFKEVSASNIDQKYTSKSYMANVFLDQLVAEYKKTAKSNDMDLDTMLAGFDKEIESTTNQMQAELGGMMMSFDEERKAEIDAAIKRCEAEGKTEAIEKLNQIKNTLDEAFNLTKFAEACKTIKIKRYDLEKPKRVYESFNFKYEKHKNTINDISTCADILDRHLPEFTYNQKLMVCLAFCKYCLNFSPDDMEEHTFMYYFIRNIIVCDRINPKGNLYEAMDDRSKEFYDKFMNSLKVCIVNISERNATLK